ncbi:MAG: iron uptake transporter deferrochelatase/peroxidase subunit [Paracoccus sp. (in: a-proteobacteria)]|uniref:iron uptake transporter deferrochelatase/peroxidase subunit n=1 Tax=Paracoccus sp. TaxID=267 RepID=UPI0026DF043D|nr:iron uptake transporter deferrochelatase/peroxidase subunit [Paracoccus sp. (in: a-proteobacteria)]MDO5614485.1 iron uptake transporter deferrochelatase/peroxidase subunit [Paracoccus sp. (in: a-proteobacteria)]
MSHHPPIISDRNPARNAPRPHASRRQILGALAACPFAGLPLAARAQTDAPGHSVTDAPVLRAASPADHVPFRGRWQAGVVTPRPANGMIASFDVVAETPDDLEDLLRRLTDRIAFLTTGGAVPDLAPRLPPADSGILGPEVMPDALTITVSLGASLFENRPWLAPLKPRHLTRMTRFPNDALDASLCHGDLSLQICANTQDTTIHALRDLIKNLPDRLILKWKQEGNVPVIAPGPDGAVESARNFLGFRDGSANPDAGDTALMQRLIWVGPERGEPEWALNGSYQLVRIIRNFVERWDRTPLGEQERIMGRIRTTGAPLDAPDTTEFDTPDYTTDPEGLRTPLDSHIRLANPRTPESDENIILRRPFNYSNGVTKSGQLDQGLLFICYQADLDKGFIAVQRRLDGEPLEEYIKPVGGGYFYTLPGAGDAPDYIGSPLIAAARSAATAL